MTAPDMKPYANATPPLVLETFFNGKTTAHGTVEDWRGRVTRRFHAEIVGTFDTKAGTGILDETFWWNDGEVQKRVWNVRKTGKNADGFDTYAGTAGDVVGEATGVAAGNTLNWRYTLAVPVNGKPLHLQLDDWMYLLPDGTLMNLTTMHKFGLKVGRISLFIQPVKK